MKLSIGSDTQKNKTFELVIQVRDNKGNCLGRTKSFETESATELEEIWTRNNGIVKKRKKRKTEAAKKHEVEDAVKQATGYVEKIKKNKKLKD